MADENSRQASRNWETLVNTLTESQRRAISTSIADGMLAGWQPELRNVELLTGLASGALTFDQYRDRVLTDVANSRPAAEIHTLAADD